MDVVMRKVSWRRGDRWILRDIDWQVERGQHWALLGLNGSGKTTLLSMLNGYIWPTRGEIEVLGQPFGSVDLRELRKSIGWVSSALQETLISNETVEQIVLSGRFATLGLFDPPTVEEQAYAQSLLADLGCAHLGARRFSTLSQGEQQRVLIGRALMAQPRLLILDEPCTGLDLFARESLLGTIEALATAPDGPTLVYVTHHIEEVLPQFSHTLLLRRGQVYTAGRTQGLLQSERLSDFFESPVGVDWHGGRAWLHVAQERHAPR